MILARLPRSDKTAAWRGRTKLNPLVLAAARLIHVLPKGFHRVRHYGLLASANRAANIAHERELLAAPADGQPARKMLQRSVDLPARASCEHENEYESERTRYETRH